MSEGRPLVFPQAIGFGARALAVPGTGHTLCASAFLAFQLADGSPLTPAQWYQAVASSAGPDTVPDSVAPLPGAEILVLGKLDPVSGERREAHLRCGPVDRRFVLQADPDDPAAAIDPRVENAVWHEEDNPPGRGGPDDGRIPLIVTAGDRETPLWLGPTPFDHAARLRRAGAATDNPAGGWPPDARPEVLYEAHPAFWAEALHPGDPLEFEGLAGPDVRTRLPPYRVTITSGHDDTEWRVQAGTRIHGVTLVPGAGVGAVFYRVGIPLGGDLLGESVVVLVAALEDVDSPVRDADEYMAIAVYRWDDPVRMLDDRPLLPKALGAAVTLPFALPEDDVMAERRAATEEWIRNETGLPAGNPFAAPEGMDFQAQLEEAATPEDDATPPDANAVETVALAALAESKRRHGGTGFDTEDIDPDTPREPVPRGDGIAGEIESRLAAPFAAPHEVAMAEQIASAQVGTLDAEEVLVKLAGARAANPYPVLFWPALDDREGRRFGDAVAERLAKEDLKPRIDISSAAIGAGADGCRIAGRRLADLLAEETTWEGVEFSACDFVGGSFANGRFENCAFDGCTFDRANLSRVTLSGNRFMDCTFRDLQLIDPTWINCRFDRCVIERVTADNAAMRDLAFVDGRWQDLSWTDGLLVDLSFRGTAMRDVCFVETPAPNQRFEDVSMYRVWAVSKGFAGSVFDGVEAEQCGFLKAHFDETRFLRSSFVEVGFTAAIFSDARLAPDCRFERCNFTGAVFANSELAGVRFLNCGMAPSVWLGTNAPDAWFFGSLLRGVDFGDTVLTRAVFADADIDGASFDPAQTIGADFRGTVRADPGG